MIYVSIVQCLARSASRVEMLSYCLGKYVYFVFFHYSIDRADEVIQVLGQVLQTACYFQLIIFDFSLFVRGVSRGWLTLNIFYDLSKRICCAYSHVMKGLCVAVKKLFAINKALILQVCYSPPANIFNLALSALFCKYCIVCHALHFNRSKAGEVFHELTVCQHKRLFEFDFIASCRRSDSVAVTTISKPVACLHLSNSKICTSEGDERANKGLVPIEPPVISEPATNKLDHVDDCRFEQRKKFLRQCYPRYEPSFSSLTAEALQPYIRIGRGNSPYARRFCNSSIARSLATEHCFRRG